MADISKVRMLNGTEYNYKDAKARSDIEGLKADLDAFEPLSDNIKMALLACFQNVAWTTGNSKVLYDDLRKALYDGVIPDYNKAFAISNIVIGIASYGQQGYSQDTTNKEFACADLSSYTFMVDDIIRLEDTQRRYKFEVGTNNNQTSSDGSWNYKPFSIYDCLITQEHLPDTKVLLIKKVDGTIFTNEDIILLNSLVNVYRSAEQDPEPEWGRDYTWLYRADQDGLLSANKNVSATVGINGTLGTETLDGNNLNVSAPYTSESSGNIYKLIPITGDGVLKAKVRFHALAKSLPPSGLRIQVSNGTDGAQMFAYRNAHADAYGIYSHQGDTQYLLVDNIELERWYILSCELQGNKQVLKVDSATYTINSLASYANTETRVIVQEPGALSGYSDIGDVDVDIAWISFKDNSAQ